MTDLRQFTNYSGYYAATIIQGKPTSAAFYREFYQQLKAYFSPTMGFMILLIRNCKPLESRGKMYVALKTLQIAL
jgi:hypothetical protein